MSELRKMKRKGKYRTNPLISDLPMPSDLKALIRKLGESGLTLTEMASFFDLPYASFYEALERRPDLKAILDEAKDVPNKKVEASLFRRAIGYETREIIKIEGKPAKVIISEIAPNVMAGVFWLKNRDPKRWRDTIDVKHSLRDQFDRAHQALRLGQMGSTSPLLENHLEEGNDLEN